ncbi:MMPL family transporter [Bradyrhizobium icense]|uniref:SSD domain-containing protein n=1 Tax=Bradyrhizobium icense TaxID=1274631 RepID=A0A1B1UDN6_9BRAD|nr:MMPL family transporter [Bradyrhizobium icense]ANW00874.1 hypothetical protein LMTR13_12505 [Bradyrhizobium icense]
MSEVRKTSWFERVGQTLVRASVTIAFRRKWLVVSAALIAAGLGGYAATGLKVSTKTQDILSTDLSFFQIERRYRAAFPQRDPIIVVIDADNSTKARAAAMSLAERLKLHQGLFESVEVPGESAFFHRNALLFLPADRLTAAANELAQSRPVLSIFAQDPSLRGLAKFMELVPSSVSVGRASQDLANTINELAETAAASAEGRHSSMIWSTLFGFDAGAKSNRALVLVEPIVSEPSILGSQPALEQVNTDIASIARDYPEVTMHVTGFPVLRQQELNEVFSGAAYASVLSFALVSLSLLLIRSWRIVIALVVTLVIGSIITTGLAAVSVGRLNLISSAFLVLFFGLGVDFGTHFGLRYLEESRTGAPFRDAITRAGCGEAPAISLSALCASIGFLSFVPTSYVGLAEFGVISTLGIVVGVVLTFTLLPALMAITPPKPQARAGLQINIGNQIRRHHRGILLVATVATIAAAFVARGIRLDVNPLNLQNPQTEAVQTYRDLAKNPSTSPYALNTIAASRDAARNLASELGRIKGVAQVRTIDAFVPENQPEKLKIIREAARRLGPVLQSPVRRPDLSEGELQQAFTNLRGKASAIVSSGPSDALTVDAARRLTAALDRFADLRSVGPAALGQLDAALTGTLPRQIRNLQAMVSVSQPVTIDDIPADLRRQWITPDGRARIQILPTSEITDTVTLESFARQVQSVAPEATGVPVDVTEAGAAVSRAFLQAIAYTVVAVAIVIFVVRRSVVDLLLVLAPLGLASLWTVAGATLLGLPFNFANVIVIPLLLGLGVASSVHMVVRAREAPRGAIGDILQTSTPLAVFVAQLNTAAAFATLAVAEHRGLFSMGVLLGLSILFVLIASLIVLPAAMVLWDHLRVRRDETRARPST